MRRPGNALPFAETNVVQKVTPHDGPVQHVQKVFTIFWNPPGTPQFPLNYESTIEGFVQDLSDSSYYRIASQYTDGSGPISPILVHGGSWVDLVDTLANDPPTLLDLQTVVANANAAQGWTNDANTYYQIYTPSGIGETTNYCGFHVLDNPFYAYGLVLFPADHPGGTCLTGDRNDPYPHSDVIDAAINTTAHEIMEALTDPHGGGWFYLNAATGEIADLCNFDFGTTFAPDGSNVTLNGNPYLVQNEWSNAAGGCTLTGPGLSIEVLTGTPLPPVGHYGGAGAINNNGDVVGSYFADVNGVNYARGFTWSGGVVTLIGPSQLSGILLQEPYLSRCVLPNVCSIAGIIARGINDAGTVVGSVAVTGSQPGLFAGSSSGFRLSSAGQVTIVDVPGITTAYENWFNTYGINNNDRAVGDYGSVLDGGWHGFLTGFGSLDPPGSTTFTLATAVNDAQDVVGFYQPGPPPSTNERGFIWSAGQSVDLVAPGAWMTEPYGINNLGDIVGRQRSPSGNWFPFLFSNGIYTDIVDGTTWLDPFGINDEGAILGITGGGWAVARPRAAPGFVIEPLPQSVEPGQTAQFSVKGRGAPLPAFQWKQSTDGGATWTKVTDGGPSRPVSRVAGSLGSALYTGATTPTLTVDNVTSDMNGTLYRVDLTNTIATMSSAPALLTVTAAPLTELVTNGSFGSGTTGWQTFATPDLSYIVAGVSSGVLQFSRVPPPPGTSNQATVFQTTGVPLVAGAPILAQFQLGNTSNVRKYMKVLVIDSNFSDFAACTFWLPPNTALQTYQLRTHTIKAWANGAIYFYAGTANAPGDTGAYQIDNVSLQYTPAQAADHTDCVDPLAPMAPGGAPGANLLTNGTFGTNALPPWTTFGTITAQAPTGVLQMIRPTSTPPAGVVLQATGQGLASGQILTAGFQLGNSSSVRKRVTAIMHDLDFSDLVACVFWVEPNQALATYGIVGWTSKAWTNATLSFYAATIGPDQWTLVDNVTYQTTPATVITGSTCLEPGGTAGVLTRDRSPHSPANPLGMTARALTSPLGAGQQPPATPAADAPPASAGEQEWASDGGFVRTAASTAWESFADRPSTATLERTDDLDLGRAVSARLTFDSWLESRGSLAVVQVSIGGSAWLPVGGVTPSDGWQPTVIDLSPHAGQVIRIRFAFDARDPIDHADPDVWRLDRLQVDIDSP